MIPATVAYVDAGRDGPAHAVTDNADHALCGVLVLERTRWPWPRTLAGWHEPHDPCPACALLVYQGSEGTNPA